MVLRVQVSFLGGPASRARGRWVSATTHQLGDMAERLEHMLGLDACYRFV